jgi:predicted Zn-dependent protease
MKHVLMSCIGMALLIGCPFGVSAGQVFAQTDQPGQQQAPKYTKEQIEELKKQNERAQKQNALMKQVNEAMTAKNWHAAVAPLQQLIADDPNNWEFHSALGDVQLNRICATTRHPIAMPPAQYRVGRRPRPPLQRDSRRGRWNCLLPTASTTSLD